MPASFKPPGTEAPPPARANARQWSALFAAVVALAVGGAAQAGQRQQTAENPLGLGRPHKISWDKYSLEIDEHRVFVWAGDFHYFRLPSPILWRDVLQKIRASGFNTVQLYFSWAYHSPKAGVYDFTGIRDIDKLLKDAEDAGLYVLVRPGPYINAETDAGGLPDWILTDGPLRTDAPCIDDCPSYGSYLSQAEDWLHRVDAIIARHQLTNGGGSVIGYQLENELQETGTDGYMAKLAATVRSDGITVPIYTNQTGRWIPSSAQGTGGNRVPWNDLYGYDSYPNGFFCKDPAKWQPVPDVESAFRTLDRSTPIFSPEFQGGSIDLPGGVGYEKCRRMTGPQFERVFELTNFANGLTMESNYMTFGGTSWGWLPDPGIVYTSYDYGAMLTEGRQLTRKASAQREIGYFLDSVTPLRQTDVGSAVTATDVSPADGVTCKNGTGTDAAILPNCGAIKVYHRVNPVTHTNFYFVRHNDGRSTVDSTFKLPIATADGSWLVPRHGKIELDGRDMKVVVADYDLDATSRPQHLVYTTSNIMAAKQLDGEDVLLLWAPRRQSGETVLRYASKPTVTTLSGAPPRIRYEMGNLVMDATHDGLSVVRISGGGAARHLLLLLADDQTAQTFWAQDIGQNTVFESGPYLVRSARVNGRAISLSGDTDKAVPLRVWAPRGVSTVTWDGRLIPTHRNPDGSLASLHNLPGPPIVSLPALDHWVYRRGSPEARPDYDDSTWTPADHTATNNPHKPAPGNPVLYADDYGFHHGSVWYRGHFKRDTPLTSINVEPLIGGRGYAMVWLNGTYLGGAADEKTYAVPTGAIRIVTDNVVSVLVSNIGHDQFIHYSGKIIRAPTDPRGLGAVTTTPVSDIAWKIQGNQGGEDIADVTRGPLNNGGLYGERSGWSLPDYNDTGWSPVYLPNSDPMPGVAWYRTAFTLKEPRGIDASIGLTIADVPSKRYRAIIFLNGWNLGLYSNDVGPQHTFVLPNGILHTGNGDDGKNTLAIAVLTPDAGGGNTGGGLGGVSLTAIGVTAGGIQADRGPSTSGAGPSLQY